MLSEIRRELRRFAEITTVEGIGRTLRANNGVARTCWIVFLIVCLALLMFQVSLYSFYEVSSNKRRDTRISHNCQIVSSTIYTVGVK